MGDIYKEALGHPNVKAFLRLIREGESAQTDDAYRWLFGSTRAKPKLFDSFDDHPRVKTYEAYDGQFIKNGKIDYTTAAGAYQIVESTWDSTVRQMIGKTDFSPANQDLAAVALIHFRKALTDVMAGRIELAIEKCKREWASLPGSAYGQPTQKLVNALAVYRKFGGTLAGEAPAAPPELAPVPPSPPVPVPLPIPVPAPVPVPKPEPTWKPLPAGEAAEYGTQSQTTSPKESTMPIAPLAGTFLAGLAGNLIEIFSPLAREKINKELARHSNNPEVTAQITNSVIEAAKAVTKREDPVQAVGEAKADGTVLQQVEQSAIQQLEAMAPVLDRLASIEAAAWSAEEASRAAAATRGGALGEGANDKILIYGALGTMLALILLVGGIVITETLEEGEASTQSWAALTGIIGTVFGIVTTIYAYRFGSSRTSSAKDVIIDKLATPPAR